MNTLCECNKLYGWLKWKEVTFDLHCVVLLGAVCITGMWIPVPDRQHTTASQSNKVMVVQQVTDQGLTHVGSCVTKTVLMDVILFPQLDSNSAIVMPQLTVYQER